MNRLLKSISLLFFACILSLNLNAQDETLFNKINLKITGAWGGPHTIFSGFKGDNSFSNGGFGGLELGKTFLVGWGGYNMQTNFKGENDVSKKYELNYNGPHLAYGWNTKSLVHPTIGIMVGPGKTKIDGVDSDNIFIIQPSIGAEINIFKWFRVNLRGGYRATLDSDATSEITNSDLSSLFGGIDFKFGWSWGAEREEGAPIIK